MALKIFIRFGGIRGGGLGQVCIRRGGVRGGVRPFGGGRSESVWFAVDVLDPLRIRDFRRGLGSVIGDDFETGVGNRFDFR